jgi:hypothetical protein
MADTITVPSGARESGRLRLEAAPMWRSLLYREPSVERVAALDRWLRANPGAWVRMYHAPTRRCRSRARG